VISYCKQHGVIIGKNGATVAGFNNVLTLSPPLTIEVEDLELLINTVIDGINSIQ
jgi:taurine-pyruvate aminotransferase